MNPERPIFFSTAADDESALLGALLTAPHLFTELPNLHPLDFALPANRLVWKALVELAYLEAPLSLQAVARRLAARGELEKAGGIAYLKKLARQGP